MHIYLSANEAPLCQKAGKSNKLEVFRSKSTTNHRSHECDVSKIKQTKETLVAKRFRLLSCGSGFFVVLRLIF